MAAKKTAKPRISAVDTKKPLVKQVLPKKKRKAAAKVKAKPARRSLDKMLDISTQVAGGVVTISLQTGAAVTDLEIAVNGRGVWKGQP